MFAKSLRYLLVIMAVMTSGAIADTPRHYYYALEQDGIVCGYAHAVISDSEYNGKPCTDLQDSIWMKISAMGKSIEGKYIFGFRINPDNGMYFSHTSSIKQATLDMHATMEVHGDSVYIDSGDEKQAVGVPPGTLLQNTRMFPYLVDYFVKDTLTSKDCKIFSEIDAALNDVTYTKIGRDTLELAARSYDALAVKFLNRNTGVQAEMWVDAKSGLLLKTEHPIRSTYLTDANVRERVMEADVDKHIFAPVDTIISNPWAISYMKVRARLQPGGAWITPEGLNVAGQKFEGTVKDNRIDGVFEIRRDRYNGTNAPPFPPDFSSVDSLQPYLEPTDIIESDDSVLIKKAHELTAGSKDSWDAATRLSRWVQENIGYDLPGGVTALKTYETRLGECGSHTNLLTGFCRAAGIPARGVFGCIYVPEKGGAFGQHAWNEIYMGDAGWIPIEATAEEATYADCSHIRLAEWSSMSVMLNPEKMEILEFEVGTGTYADLIRQSSIEYDQYLGRYQGPDKVLTILLKDGRPALDIPGRMAFELKDPNENGEWFFVLTTSASVSFDIDESGDVTALTLTSRQRFPRVAATDSTAAVAETSSDYMDIIGSYTIPMQNAAIGVALRDGGLHLVFPGDKAVPLEKTETEGTWMADTGKSKLAISFDNDDSGNVSALKMNELVKCPRMD